MKRVIHIVGRMNRAGAETMLMNLYRKLDREKFQFDFVYFTEEECDYDKEIIKLGGRIFKISPIQYKNPISRTIALYKLIKKESPFHAIHCHQMFSNALHLIAGYYGGLKMRIAHSHNTSDANSNKIIGKIYHSVSKVIISMYATDYIACGEKAAKYLFPKSDKVTFLPNAIDLDNFINENDKQRNLVLKTKSLNKDTIIITQIGRLSPVKNHNFTLNFAKFLKEHNFKFHLAIVGGGILESELKVLANKLDIENYVTFCGVRSDINIVLNNSDIMIMPSFHEGFPVVLVESQACSTPSIISTNISNEVDLGMGLIHFCSLDDDFNIWFNKLKEALNNSKVSIKTRKEVLSKHGYNINLSVKNLEMFYEKRK
ncbi:glycosyltransferase [Gaetbulibacter sp. M240]|uniref:glycosyltransferase n=1 Tax=Gaetbulibacter sp. M240 TaxID=3126511 RepID=UPI00374E915B